MAFSSGISSKAFVRLGIYCSIRSSRGRKYSTLLIISDSLKVWKPRTTSGSTLSPPASRMGFWSDQSLEDTICHSTFTLASFSRLVRKGLVVKESPMSPQRMVNTLKETGSSTIGMPSAWKVAGISAMAAAQVSSMVSASNRESIFFMVLPPFILERLPGRSVTMDGFTPSPRRSSRPGRNTSE